jgi:hypothetical protein
LDGKPQAGTRTGDEGLEILPKPKRAETVEPGFEWHDPPRSLKRKLRALIEKGLVNESKRCLGLVKHFISEWENGKIGAGEAYSTILGELKKQEKIIRRRYDLRGSQYCNIVLSQLINGVIDEKDLDALGETVKRRFLDRAADYSVR